MTQALSKESINVKKKRWAAYAAAGVASTLAGAQSAEAELTWVVVGSGNGGEVVVDGAVTASLGGSAALFLNNYGLSSGGAAFAQVLGGSVAGGFLNFQGYVSNLTFGVNLSTANFSIGNGQGIMASGFGSYYVPFLNTGGYIGFQFNSGTQYGWARVSVLTGPPTNEFVLEEFAYGMVGEPVTVGQVPEPTSLSLGLLALGAIGVMEHRRRRAAG